MLKLAPGILVLAALAAPGSATAAIHVTSKDGRGDIKVRGLTSAERKAVDVRSVEVTHVDRFAVVTLQLVGDFSARAGKGGMKSAVAGVMLRPRRGRPTFAGTGGTLEKQKDARRGPGSVVVQRDGKVIRFFVSGVAEPTVVEALVTPNAIAARKTLARRSQADGLFGFIFDTLANGRRRDEDRAADRKRADRLEREREDPCRTYFDQLFDAERARANLEDRRDRSIVPRNQRALQKKIDELNAEIRRLKAKIEECDKKPGTGTPGTGTPGTSPPPPPPPPPPPAPVPFAFTTPRPTTQPGDFFLNTQWHTLTTGGTTDVADTVEVEVPAPHSITGFYAKTGGPCKFVGEDGTEYGPDAGGNYTIPPGVRLKAVRCPGKETKEVEFRLTMDPPPVSGMQVIVRAVKGSATDTEVTTVP